MRIGSRSLALATTICVACTGLIEGSGRNGNSSRANDGTNGTFSGTTSSVATANSDGTAPKEASVGLSPLRRLGKIEFQNTLRDLLPALPQNFSADSDLPSDNDVALAFSVPGTVSNLEAKRFLEIAEATLSALGSETPGRHSLCNEANETECAKTFVTNFAKRAFRRPLAAIEVDDLLALFVKLRTDPELKYTIFEALDVLVEAILQSPGFLYRWERGYSAAQVDGSLVKFDDYEMASRLSYFIWSSMPDAELTRAADDAKLATPDAVGTQAERLLADPRADRMLSDFFSQWLELGPLSKLVKDADTYPDFTPELRSAMQSETLAFVRNVLRGPDPTFTTLLTADYTYADANLARYYGISSDASGRADLSKTERRGLLTQAGLMAVKGNSYRTSPVRRGKFILERLLCSSVEPPPPNVVPELPPPDPSKTLREQMAMHQEDPGCATCHVTMDSLGFAFEHFDGAGKYRTTDQGQAIDAGGTLEIDDVTSTFKDARELAIVLAQSREARACFAVQWLRYAIDRFEHAADAAATQHLAASYEKSGLDTRKLIVEITRTLPFSHRAPAQGEVLSP